MSEPDALFVPLQLNFIGHIFPEELSFIVVEDLDQTDPFSLTSLLSSVGNVAAVSSSDTASSNFNPTCS